MTLALARHRTGSPQIGDRVSPEERRDLAATHLARAARLWPAALEARRAEVLAELAETWPTQLRSLHILCLARGAATVEERVAIATALLAGTPHHVARRPSP